MPFRIAFQPAWPPLVLIVVIAALVGIAWWSYRPFARRLSKRDRWLLLSLRMLAVLLVLLTLLRPEVQYADEDDSKPQVVLLFDRSRSMTVPDMPGGRTRRQALIELIEESRKRFDTLAEKVQLRAAEFAETAQPLDGLPSPEDLQSEGEQTAIGNALKSVLEQGGTDPPAAVLLLSDGAERTLSPSADDPRAIARQYGEQSIPVYSVPLGGEGIAGALDLVAEEINVDPFVFEKKSVPVSGRVRITGAAGQAFTVRLLLEDRAGRSVGETGEMKPLPASAGATTVKQVTAGSNNATIPIELTFVPDQPGEFKLALEIVPADGELKTTNNRLETIVTVRRGGLRVAYFDSILRPEARWLRNVNTEQNIQLDFYSVRPGGGESRIDSEVFNPGRYDVFLIGDVTAATFGNDHLKALAARVNEGAGLMMLGGLHSFSAGGYARTPIAPLLPVELSVAAANAPDSSLQYTEDLRMQPTRAGLQHYVMRLSVSDENAARWTAMPPLRGANRLRAKPGLVEILAESATGVPLLFAQEVGRARVMAFAGDTTYLWFTAGYVEEHQRFWRQVILWLARKEEETDSLLWIAAEPRSSTPGRPVQLSYGTRDDEGQPLVGPTVNVSVIRPGGDRQEMKLVAAAPRNQFDFLQTTKAGDYWVRATAENNGSPLGEEVWTRFLVNPRDLELDNPAADPALLGEIAALTGGRVVPPEQLADLIDQWIADPPGRSELSKQRRTSLWDHPWLPVLFVLVLGIEWFLRKRRGLV